MLEGVGVVVPEDSVGVTVSETFWVGEGLGFSFGVAVGVSFGLVGADGLTVIAAEGLAVGITGSGVGV